MRLFSEKVKPTFTSSNLNIITVKDYQEIFFDVFEFEINGKKFIAEKISEYKGFPVIEIPLVLEGKKLTAPFVLQQGEFEVLFNENNSKFIELEKEEKELIYEESIETKNEIEDIIFEKREDILSEINSARQSAVKYIEKLKLEKLDQASKEIEKSKNFFKEEIDNSKKDLLEEFISLINATKSDLVSESDLFKDNLIHFVENKIEEISSQLADSIDSKQHEAETKFSEQINELATNILSGVLLKELDNKTNRLTKDFNDRYESVSLALKDVVKKQVSLLEKNISAGLTDNNNDIVNLQKANIELNDKINKDSNRALSRIGNIKTQLDESIQSTKEDIVTLIDSTSDRLVADITTKFNQADENIVESIVQKISKAEEKISGFYESKINTVRQELESTTEQNRGDILRLIDESRQSILAEVSNIKVDVPNIIIEKANGKQTVDLKGIKTELEKVIGTRFSNELQSLKRLIEMSSGGGSVAKQFAAGGTMDGDLNVTGQYLSAGVDLLTIFSGSSDDIFVNTLVRSNSANWDEAYNTSVIYQSNSASYATIDFTNSKFFPLSGGTITGNTTYNSNVTINGNLTATGTTTFSNTVFSVTSALSVVHIGGGPAVWVGNNGTGDIASFYDIDQNIEVLHVGGINSTFPNVGVHTSNPNERFTVSGNISASSSVFANNIVYKGGNTDNTSLIIGTNDGQSLNFETNGTTRMSITSAGNISATGTSNTLPNQTFVDSSSILTKSYLDSRNSFTSSTQQTRLTSDSDYQFGVVEYFNDYLEIPSTTGAYTVVGTVTGSGGSIGNALGDQSSVDIMVSFPTGNDNFTSRGILQAQVAGSYNSAVFFAPTISIGQNRAQYYTQNVAWRVLFAQNDSSTYYRFGVQPPMGGSFGLNFTGQQRALCFDGTVSPNFFFNAPNLRTYTTSFSADTGIPCLTGMWCNIYMDVYPSTTTYKTISVIDVTVNYPLSGLRYTYRFTPTDASTGAASTGWWKQQATGIVIGQQDIRGGNIARKGMYIDWIYVKTAPLTAFTALPSNWNSTRFLK